MLIAKIPLGRSLESAVGRYKHAPIRTGGDLWQNIIDRLSALTLDCIIVDAQVGMTTNHVPTFINVVNVIREGVIHKLVTFDWRPDSGDEEAAR